MYKVRGPPTSRRSTPATPSRHLPQHPGSGPCSNSKAMCRVRGPPTSRRSTPATEQTDRGSWLGALLEQQGDVQGARTAYQQAIDSGHRDLSPKMAVNLGALLHREGDVQAARTAYQRAIDSGHS